METYSGLLPSGILHDGITCVIGNGVVIDPQALFAEIDELAARFDIRIDWGIDDVDDDALAGTDATALLVRAGEQLCEHHYTLWTWDTGMETHAGWITHQRDDEALPVVAGALGFHVRPAAL